MNHWIIAPLLLPLAAAVANLFLGSRGPRPQATVSLCATAGLLPIAIGLLLRAWTGVLTVYQLGNWPAPFGIVLVLARLFAGNAVQMRLDTLDGKKVDTDKGRRTSQRWMARVISLTRPLVKLSLPEDGWEESPIRIRFINAGWRKSTAPALFYAAKTGLTLLFPLLVLYR